jgi:two-component system sensor histidine kinase HupT/HoxJ
MDLVPVVERAVHWVSKAAPNSFSVEVDLPAELMVVGSAGQLQQVMMNLVQNACDATAGQPKARLAVSTAIDGGSVRLRFADNGPGIAPEDLPHIFDQLSPPAGRQAPGSGWPSATASSSSTAAASRRPTRRRAVRC